MLNREGYAASSTTLGTTGGGHSSLDGDQSSTTTSSVSGGVLVVKDAAGQAALNGLDVATVVASIDRSAVTGSSANDGKITRQADVEQLKAQVDDEAGIYAKFGADMATRVGTYANEQAADLKAQASAETDPDRKAALLDSAAHWGEGGPLRAAAHAAVGLLTGGVSGALGASASALAVPTIKEAVAALNLSEADRAAVVALTGAAVGAVVGGAAGAATGDTQIVHNYLKHEQWDQLAKDRLACHGDSACETGVDKAYVALSNKQDAALATCDVRGDCAALKEEVRLGALEQLKLVQSGALPDYLMGAGNLQSNGEKLAANAAARSNAARALAVIEHCKTDPAACDKRALINTAPATLGVAVLAGAAVTPALIAVAEKAVLGCLADPVLCVNEAGLVAGEIAADGTVGPGAVRDSASIARLLKDTSNDAELIAMTDQTLLKTTVFNHEHSLIGDLNRRGEAGGYHAEQFDNINSRIMPGSQITVNPNGTYEAKVQIWDPAEGAWLNKKAESTFFPQSWSPAKIEYELTEAYKSVQSTAQSFIGISPSGISIWFNRNVKDASVSYYPLR